MVTPPCLPPFLQRGVLVGGGGNLHDFLFTSLEDKARPKEGNCLH